MKARLGITAAWVVLLGTTGVGIAQDGSGLGERVAAIKQTLAESQTALKSYEWIETTSFSLKGEEKSRVQNRCYYGADGKIQKVPVGAPPAEQKKKRGIRGAVIENKKEEISATMQQAKALIGNYVPPDPAKIQASFAAGKASLVILEPGKRVRVDFKDYFKPGDVLGLEVDLAQNRLTKLSVASYLAKPEEAVTLHASMGTLDNGASYTSQTVMDVKSAEVKTVVENSGYRKSGS